MQSIITIYLLGICCLRFVVAAWHSQECFPCVFWKESSVAQNSRISQTFRTVNSRDPLHGFHKIVPEWAACLMARNTSLCLWADVFRSILPNSSERLYRGRLNRKPLSPGQHNQNRKQPQVPTVYFDKASQGNSMISVSMKNLFFCISYRLSKPPCMPLMFIVRVRFRCCQRVCGRSVFDTQGEVRSLICSQLDCRDTSRSTADALPNKGFKCNHWEARDECRLIF